MQREKTLKKQLISQFFRKNKFLLVVATFASMLGGTLNLILSWIMQQLVDAASGAEGALPFKTLALLSGGLILLCTAMFLLDYISQPRFIAKAMRQYKDFAFQKLTEKEISSFNDENTATYLSALTNDATAIEAGYLSKQLTLITKAVEFFGAIAMMLWYSPSMTAIAVGLTIFPVIASVLTGNKLSVAEQKVSEKNTGFTGALSDCLSGFSIVKSFKAEKEIFNVFAKSNKELEHEKFSRERVKALVGMMGSLTGIFAQLGVFVFCTYFALKGYGFTPGVVMVFVNLMNLVIEPIATLPGILASRKASVALIEKLANSLEKNEDSSGTKEVSKVSDAIEIKNLSFGYEEDKEILHNISARFEAGKAYAIVGGSGSGKSTLLNLIMASRTDYKGSITYDDTNLRDISMDSLYECMSIIQQNVFVFNASIRDNITMFKEFPEADVEDAIKKAHLNSLIEDRGKDYLCGENGKGLSGGEKQRISIARSLLKKASVLLVDEATAALDAKTAYQVSDDILGISGITRIVVTHSLEENLLKRYDAILVIKDGRIEEFDSFDALMENKGYFYALYTISH